MTQHDLRYIALPGGGGPQQGAPSLLGGLLALLVLLPLLVLFAIFGLILLLVLGLVLVVALVVAAIRSAPRYREVASAEERGPADWLRHMGRSAALATGVGHGAIRSTLNGLLSLGTLGFLSVERAAWHYAEAEREHRGGEKFVAAIRLGLTNLARGVTWTAGLLAGIAAAIPVTLAVALSGRTFNAPRRMEQVFADSSFFVFRSMQFPEHAAGKRGERPWGEEGPARPSDGERGGPRVIDAEVEED